MRPEEHDAPPSSPADIEEEERRPYDDWDWVMTDPEVRRRYGGKMVAVNRRTVWGGW